MNGTPVRRADYERAVEALASDRRDGIDDADKRHVLDRLVDEEVLVQRALELGLARSDRRVRGDLVAAVIEAVTADAGQREPDDAELRAFFDANRDYFARPGRLQVEQVFVRSRSDADAAALDRARDAAARLRSGAPAAEVQANVGDAPVAAVPDAPLPAAKLREYLGPAAVEAVATLDPGDVAEPVRGAGGYLVLRLVGREPNRTSRVRGGRVRGARRVASPRRRRCTAHLPRSGARTRRDRRHADASLKRALRPALVVVALLAAFAGPRAEAHGRSLSYSSWKITQDGAIVRVRIPRLELTRLALDPVLEPGTQADVIQLLAERVQLSSRGQRCVPSADPAPAAAPEGWVVYEWTLKCPNPGAPVVSSTLLLDVAPSHLHFARVEMPDGSVREAVLSEAQTTWALGDLDAKTALPDAAGTSLLGYVVLGIKHIATGYDHIAFVLALLLLAASLREVAGLVTGFTIGHSLTLALAVLGVVRPEASAIEALIGFSIALVATENSWLLGGRPRAIPIVVVTGLVALAAAASAGYGVVAASTLLGLALFSGCHFGLLDRTTRPAQVRAAVAFAFGLVHGFGFAGVLAELELPTDRLVAALFGFNAGVEVGQLVVVAMTWPVLRALARVSDGRWHDRVAAVGSAAICGLGLFWFLTRALSQPFLK